MTASRYQYIYATKVLLCIYLSLKCGDKHTNTVRYSLCKRNVTVHLKLTRIKTSQSAALRSRAQEIEETHCIMWQDLAPRKAMPSVTRKQAS